MDKQLTRVLEWYQNRTNRERLWVLLLGVIVITFTWYFFVFDPLMKKNMTLRGQANDLKHQIIIYKNKIEIIETEGPKNFASRKQRAEQVAASQQKMTAMRFETGSIEYHDALIHAIFTKMPNLKVTQLKGEGIGEDTSSDKNRGEQNLEIYFKTDYFGTIAYLETLEKLPWCLSWDALEYKVTHYPEADISLQLHIVNT